jgi:hypothetical protein
VDPQRHRPTVDLDVRAVTDVGMPEPTGTISRPASALPLAVLARERLAVEVVKRIQPTHGRGLDRASLELALLYERVEDQRHRGVRVLAPDVEQQSPLLVMEAERKSTCARARLQRSQAASAIAMQPTLERGHGEGPRALAARRAHALLTERAQQLGLFAVLELGARQRAEHLQAKQRHGFVVILGFQIG